MLNELEMNGKYCAGQSSLRIVNLSSVSYLKHLCDGRSPFIADVVVFKVELFDGGVFLSEINRKDTVRGGAKLARNARETMNQNEQTWITGLKTNEIV